MYENQPRGCFYPWIQGTGSCSINSWAHLIEFQLPGLCPEEVLWSLEYFLFSTEDSSSCFQAGKENHRSGGILLIRFFALLPPCGIFKPQLMENVINRDFLDILHKCDFYLPFLHWVLHANFIHFFKKRAGIFQYQLLSGLTLSVGFIARGGNGALHPPPRSPEMIQRDPLVREHF